jgi:hypothetical protein
MTGQRAGFMSKDEEHLRLLAIFHYVVAALSALFCSFPLIHVAVGLLMVFAPENFKGRGELPARAFGWMFVAMGSIFVVTGWVFAACVFFAGHSLMHHRHYMFCLVMAALECCLQPFGTVLGVFTIIVLLRDSVKQLFAGGESPFASGTIEGTRGV